MPFPYRYICDLLQQLDDEGRKAPGKQVHPDSIVTSWFQQHRCLINAPESDICAILSTLLPERRTDRVYNIQAPKLQSIFGKALLLGASRVLELRRWSESGTNLDLADCVEAALRQTPNSRDDTTHLTVEEIDETLGRVAAACRFSSPAVRALHQASNLRDLNALLADIYTRLGSRDAKWFTRLVLKNYRPVELNEHVVFRSYHPLLPQMMKIRDDLAAATAYVRHIDETRDAPETIASILKPRLGTKVGRQPWLKGRSIKHCMDMAQGREVLCEQKIDGEYCQIHIDLQKPRDCIRIFSKSGKDSTADRIGLHKSILESLKIGHADCQLAKGCILEGELVVYSTKDNKILPFHKIRKHVSRSGSFLGTANDSQAHGYEHLMIIYYDVLLIDDESLLGIKNSERFRRLSKLITCQKGYAELVPRNTIHTSRASAVPALRDLFAQCISSRGEGLVLKPDEPYFDFSGRTRRYGCFNIKLKKEYIQGWGDVGDFAVIGASYDAAKAKEYRMPNVRWTHFFIGCLENSNQVRVKTEMPRFRVTNVVELTGPILSAFWAQGRPLTVPYKENSFIELDYSGSALPKKPTVVFPTPLVFDMRCFAFDREPNTDFWSMRFPQVAKVHHDRSYLDTITFSELQNIAEAATHVPEEEDSQEMRQWVKALEKMDRGKFIADTLSQATTCSDTTYSSSSSTPSRYNIEDSRRDILIPPASSAVETGLSSAEPETNRLVLSASKVVKRPIAEQTQPGCVAKRTRRQSGASSMHSSQQNATTGSASSRTRHREPLSQVDPNASENLRTGSQNSPSSLPLTDSMQEDADLCAGKTGASSPIAYYTASEMMSSSPGRVSRTQRSSVTTRTQSKPSESNAPCCSIASHECALASCSVLLSPCISSYAWITDDLLKSHGIVDPLLDPRVWHSMDSRASSYRSTGSFRCDSTPRATPGRRYRKICLVESRRKEATQAFLQKIKDADLRRKDGEREWVAVYDWRVLETITEQELQEKPGRGTDPWRRFYVGLI
ncbi:hypothetical protein F5B22DRAFT_343135 [Xylaria bambusicola]|uniref:uncharacterized protein n=1 Tax=Xylaria bambusicola TaxID=326684 RepID=UPI002008143D|nr:uncharacterized protein F5B22DRAFT_343135 [Xylaria bambusicola]KAI0525474.1 hypothetical protein F5B22DRAFT_343135 [Xylaria bambusicola]